ncbi:type II toxin-antitoxin system HicA family toxin [Actinomyces oris]|uniref:type II toxin-antitoxin system HicA family toxin n=1 Tax=Actinomyces oris TaxID=544580 RepID=UPI00211718CB|nr:type II toxin-antitoxin system HicA family toxin [Actinomyces oris]
MPGLGRASVDVCSVVVNRRAYNRCTHELFSGYTAVVKVRELNRRIEALGGVMTRQCGSHRRYEVVSAKGVRAFTVVPQHAGEVPVGTLAAIDRDLAPVLGKGWTRR